jgi:hypothetical protein
MLFKSLSLFILLALHCLVAEESPAKGTQGLKGKQEAQGGCPLDGDCDRHDSRRHSSHSSDGEDCGRHCKRRTAFQATSMIINTLTKAINEQNISLIQGVIISDDATLHVKVFNAERQRCIDHHVQPYMTAIVPGVYAGVTISNLVILDQHQKDDGSIVVKATFSATFNGNTDSLKATFVFVPAAEGSCEFELKKEKVFSEYCC